MSFPDEGPRHESRLQQTALACGSCFTCQGFLPKVKLRQILILGQEIIQAARRSAVGLLRVCLESLSDRLHDDLGQRRGGRRATRIRTSDVTAEAETCPTLPVASFHFRRKLSVGTWSSLRNVMPFDLLHSPVE
jgi:hypothetical protein